MLQVARLAPRQLGEAGDLVADFLRSQLNEDGGFKNRAGASDIYYTVFGLEGLLALRADLPHDRIASYLKTVGPVDSLDLVHVCCLARCWANLPTVFRDLAPNSEMLTRIETFRSADGGYNTIAKQPHGTTYGCFLAAAGCGDARGEMPNPQGVIDCLATLKCPDGGYANMVEVPVGLTPSTAAVATLLRHLQQPTPAELSDWLLSRCSPAGDFSPFPKRRFPIY